MLWYTEHNKIKKRGVYLQYERNRFLKKTV